MSAFLGWRLRPLRGYGLHRLAGSAKLREILELTERAGVTLRLARVKPAVHELLRRDQILDRIGDHRIHRTIPQAVEAQLVAAAAPEPERGKDLNPP
jgi:hypothetical protein